MDEYTDDFLQNPDHWHDHGLDEYFFNGCKDWLDIAARAPRVTECDENSNLQNLISTIAATSWQLALERFSVLIGNVDYLELSELVMSPNDFELSDGCGFDAILSALKK